MYERASESGTLVKGHISRKLGRWVKSLTYITALIGASQLTVRLLIEFTACVFPVLMRPNLGWQVTSPDKRRVDI